MKNYIAFVCLALLIGVGCGTFQKQEPGVFEPNKIQKINSYTSKMVARAEQVKISNGIPLPKQTNSVKSFAISPPAVTNSNAGSTMDVPRGLTITPDKKLPAYEPQETQETQETQESLIHRAVRYSIVWACILGFGYLIYLSAKKYKMPKGNPFKNPTPDKPNEQLTLKL